MSDRNAVTNAVTNGGSNGPSNAGQTRPVVVIPSGITTKRSLTRSLSSGTASPDAADAQARAELQADYARERLERFQARRPPRLAAPGALDPRLLGWAREVFGGSAGNLVITGSTGTGKTWSAWRIAEELLRRGWRGRAEIASAYQLKQLATPPADTGGLTRLACADLLALDDVGAVRVSDWDADHLYALVDERWAHQRPTIVIANATALTEPGKSLLASLLGDRVASRIADGVTVVVLAGADRRRSPC